MCSTMRRSPDACWSFGRLQPRPSRRRKSNVGAPARSTRHDRSRRLWERAHLEVGSRSGGDDPCLHRIVRCSPLEQTLRLLPECARNGLSLATRGINSIASSSPLAALSSLRARLCGQPLNPQVAHFPLELMSPDLYRVSTRPGPSGSSDELRCRTGCPIGWPGSWRSADRNLLRNVLRFAAAPMLRGSSCSQSRRHGRCPC